MIRGMLTHAIMSCFRTAQQEFEKLCFDFGIELDDVVESTYIHFYHLPFLS